MSTGELILIVAVVLGVSWLAFIWWPDEGRARWRDWRNRKR